MSTLAITCCSRLLARNLTGSLQRVQVAVLPASMRRVTARLVKTLCTAMFDVSAPGGPRLSLSGRLDAAAAICQIAPSSGRGVRPPCTPAPTSPLPARPRRTASRTRVRTSGSSAPAATSCFTRPSTRCACSSSGGRAGPAPGPDTAVATMRQATATAVTSPNVRAAPLLSAIDDTIIPATPTPHTTITTRRTERGLTRGTAGGGRVEGRLEALEERLDRVPVGGPGLEVQGEGPLARDHAQVDVVQGHVRLAVRELPLRGVEVVEVRVLHPDAAVAGLLDGEPLLQVDPAGQGGRGRRVLGDDAQGGGRLRMAEVRVVALAGDHPVGRVVDLEPGG